MNQDQHLLLISFNARYTHLTLAHYYQKRLVEQHSSCTCTLLEYTINANIERTVLEICSYTPQVLCFSVYIWNSAVVRRVIADLKLLLPDAKFVLGGPEVEYDIESWRAERIIPVKGREDAFLSLLNNNFVQTQFEGSEASCMPLSKVPFPYTQDELSGLSKRYVYYESSRGCIRRCSYCLSSAEGVVLEYRPLSLVLPELKQFIEAGAGIVKFIDRTFNADATRAREIWKHIVKINSSTVFHFEIDASLLSEKDFSLLQSVPPGMFNFEIGIQSIHSNTLREIGRPSDITPVLDAVRRLKAETNVHLHVDLIAGLPFEGRLEYEESFNAVISLGADAFQPGFLKLLKGSRMEVKSEDYGMRASAYPPYQVYETSWLSTEDVAHLMSVEDLVESIYNRHVFSITAALLSEVCGGSFAFYSAFAVFCRENSFDTAAKKSEKIAQALHAFSGGLNLDFQSIEDTLNYDFLRAEPSLRLLFADEKEVMKDTSVFFEDAKDNDWPFEKKHYARRTVVFAPKSDIFYRVSEYTPGTLFCFINGSAPNGQFGDYYVCVRSKSKK